MPLYDFACAQCRNRFEARTGFDEPGPACPACGSDESERLISGFATSRSPGLRGLAAQRSNDTRRVREQQRAERREQRRNQPPG
jgi:putative FmdB family regulatory protein